MTLYLVRHQVHGVLTECAFVQPPTARQLAALAMRFAARHGVAHPKTGEPYWLRVVELPLLGPGDELAPELTGGGPVVESSAGIPNFGISAIGHVENP